MSNAKTEVLIQINGGQDIPLAAQQIISIAISKEVNKIPTATILIRDGEADKQDFPISNEGYFKPGVAIEIFMGTPQAKASVFKGVVTHHALKIKKDRTSVLMVECKDEAFRLNIGRKSRFWNEVSDSDIFQEIIDEYAQLELATENSSSIVTHPQIVQYYASDWDFIAMRAESIGKYIFTDDGKLTIAQPQLDAEATVTLEYACAADTPERSRIWEFESQLDARYQFEEVNTLGWDYSKQEVTQGSNSFQVNKEAGDISSGELAEIAGLSAFQMHHQARMDENELNAFADAVKQKSILNKSRGRIKIDGRGDLKPGQMIQLNGVGNRFNGNVFVSRVHHTFTPGRWFTQVQFGLPYSWFYENNHIPNPPVQGLLPAVKGLQIGQVIQLEGDQNFRVKVSISGFHQTNEGVWARLATFHAGNDRGALFLPELGDEVVIGYIGEDSREPIILGTLYSESNAPVVNNSDDNFIKGFYTRNGNQIQFDDQNDIITIQTAANQTITLEDQSGSIELADKNRNTITMDSSGITLKSGSDINIEASTGNVNVKGLSVELIGNTMTKINNNQGGVVKLGNGVLPAAMETDIVTGAVGAGLIGKSKNVKVLI
ncbi:MAG: type VI secretion system tip protein VgrG [Bacteroidota bacterium]